MIKRNQVTHVTSVESPVLLHTIDVACAVLSLWFGMSDVGGLDPKLVVRTFDLTSAMGDVLRASEYLTLSKCMSYSEVVCCLLVQYEVYMLFCDWQGPYGG